MEIVVKAISEAREWQSAQSPPLFRDSQLPPNPGNARVQHPLQVRSGMLLCNVDGAWDAAQGTAQEESSPGRDHTVAYLPSVTRVVLSHRRLWLKPSPSVRRLCMPLR
ncbi:hypothetical protein Bca52824_024803 [Brassica carinata]|uniref:Uncharacterized protein n=1 Tax=Brassica carinata TaxID=52824 RepID=A0A8X7VL28_BRACI|nr:hypothetical protein Bca52824_024803 [Brassica carinata]